MAKLVSRTYGDALFELALEEKRLDEFFKEAEFVRDTFQNNEELLKVLHHPKIAKQEKLSFIHTVFEGYVSEEMQGFLNIIITKDRYGEVIPIFAYFIQRVKRHKGIGLAKVTSAIELDSEQKGSIEKKLLATTKYQSFEMEYQVDPAILGGLIIRIDDRVADSSLKTQLDMLTKKLSGIQLS